MKFSPDKDKHSWNAVYINGSWGLVDAQWAAREVIKKIRKLRYRLDEYYFLPDPHHFICDHFPDDDHWQLLERPITLEEFENMPHIKHEFFKYGLEFVSHHTVIIYGQGEVNVRLRYPFHKHQLDFHFILQFESGEEEEYNGQKNVVERSPMNPPPFFIYSLVNYLTCNFLAEHFKDSAIFIYTLF